MSEIPEESANGLVMDHIGEDMNGDGVHEAAENGGGKVAVSEEMDNAQPATGSDQSDETLENLTSKLKAALKENITKDNLVKQHAKVAEDAITGWEKAVAEAEALKQQLDKSLQQKTTLEERVAYLDGALKEVMKQRRTEREEQEQKQEEMTQKVRDSDVARSELEGKLLEAEAKMVAAASENAALEQRVLALAEAKSQAEADARKVANKVESLEKENINLKHDVRASKKDLVSLNNDSKKASETAKQQLAESSRKLSRLEAECQKLKSQLRKRSSVAAASQTRGDGEGLDRRKSLGRLTGSPRAFSVEAVDDSSEMGTRDTDEKLFSLEEETKTLKGELAKRNKELQAARHMCARTACNLSNVEEQLETICGAQENSKLTLAGLSGQIETLRAFGNNQQPGSQGSTNGDEADAWASALVAELAQFKKDEKKADKLFDTTSFELMDDFLEMEKLTSGVPAQPWDKVEAPVKKENGGEAAVPSTVERQLHSTNGDHADVWTNGGHRAMEALDSTTKPKVASLISKIIRMIELVAENSGLEHEQKAMNGGALSDSDSNTDQETIALGMRWSDVNVDTAFEKLAASGNGLLQGKTDFIGFTEEISVILEQLAGLQVSNKPVSLKADGDVEKLKEENAQLGSQLSVLQASLTKLEAEKAALEAALNESAATCSKITSECDSLKLRKQEAEEELAMKSSLIEQLQSTISALEEDVSVAEERAHSTVKGLSTTFEEDLSKERSEKEAVQRKVEAMNVVMAELEVQKAKLEEDAKTHLRQVATLEDEMKRGRLDKLAAQKDIDAVNQDIQTLMADFIQLQHEKQSLEEALHETKTEKLEERSKTVSYLDTVSRLEEELRQSILQRDENKRLAEEARMEVYKFHQREEALQKSMSEKDAKQIEMLVRIEKLKEERAQLEAAKGDLELKLAEVSEHLQKERHRVAVLEEDARRLVVLEDRLNQNDESLKLQQVNFISLQDEFYQLKIEKEDLEQAHSMAEENVKVLQARVAALDEECKRLKDENANIQDGLKQDVQRVQGEFDRSDRELKLVTTEKETLIGEVEELTRAIELMKVTCDEKETKLSALRNAKEELETKVNHAAVNVNTNDELERKLHAAVVNIKDLETECIRLESERSDLEHVLAATNEIVQGVKEECSRLANVEEELKLDKEELESRLAAAEESIKSLSQELKNTEGDKAELEHDLALSQVTWKSQVFEGEELVASLRAELALSAKAKQLAEEQLAESFSAKAEMQYQVKAALHESSQLSERTKVLEAELENERTKKQAIAAEIDELRQQPARDSKDGEATSSSREIPVCDKNIDLAAKLDECHRAILSLGEQLQSLSMSRNSPSPTQPYSSDESISTGTKTDAEGSAAAAAAAELVAQADAQATPQRTPSQDPVLVPPENGSENGEGKVFVPSLPLEGRPRSKSTSPAKSKSSKAGSELSKSIDMSASPSEKHSSSSAFSRFFRGKSSSSSSHHHS